MKIAIDVQPLQYGARDAGIGCYLRNLLEHLAPIANGHDLRLLVNGRVDPARDLKLGGGARWPVIRLDRPRVLGDRGWLWSGSAIPGCCVRTASMSSMPTASPELHGITTPRPTARCRVVVTVHDIIPLLFRADHDAYWPRAPFSYDYRRRLRDVACADAIIVPSEHTRRDLVEHLGMPGERVTVTPEAVEGRFAPVARRGTPDGGPARLRAPRSLHPLRRRLLQRAQEHPWSARGLRVGFLRKPGTEPVKLVLAGARSARGRTADALRRRDSRIRCSAIGW